MPCDARDTVRRERADLGKVVRGREQVRRGVRTAEHLPYRRIEAAQRSRGGCGLAVRLFVLRRILVERVPYGMREPGVLCE